MLWFRLAFSQFWVLLLARGSSVAASIEAWQPSDVRTAAQRAGYYLIDPFEGLVRGLATVALAGMICGAVATLVSDVVHEAIVSSALAIYFVAPLSEQVVHLHTWHITRVLSATTSWFLYFYSSRLTVNASLGIAVDSTKAQRVFAAAHLARFTCSVWTIGCGALLAIYWALGVRLVIEAVPRLV